MCLTAYFVVHVLSLIVNIYDTSTFDEAPKVADKPSKVVN